MCSDVSVRRRNIPSWAGDGGSFWRPKSSYGMSASLSLAVLCSMLARSSVSISHHAVMNANFYSESFFSKTHSELRTHI
jgi:hypothetical protein